MINTTDIHTYDFFHPQQNLAAGRVPMDNPEERFSLHFSAVYKESFTKIHSKTTRQEALFVREMPVDGHGIADLVAINWNNKSTTSDDFREAKPIVRAFEFKISDWRGGLMQAHRYRYFSHAAILVLPKKKLKLAQKHIHLFKTLRVGLWGFDFDTETIIRVFTPRPKRQFVDKYGDLAINHAFQVALS